MPLTKSRWKFGPLDAFDLLLLAGLAATYVAVALAPFSAKKFGDDDFHIEAQNFARFVRGLAAWSDLALARAPLPSLYYTIPYLIVPPTADDNAFWLAGFLWTAVWMGVSLWLVRRAAGYVAGPLAGKIAGVLVLAAPFSVYYGWGIVAEPCAYLGLALFVYGWSAFRAADAPGDSGERFARLGYAGIVIFLGSRPNGILMVPVALAAALVLRRRATGEAKREAGFALGCVAWSLAASLAFFVFAKALPGRKDTTRQLSHLTHILMQGAFQFRDEPFDWRFWRDGSRQGSADFAGYLQKYADLGAVEQATQRPIVDIRLEWLASDLAAHPLRGLRQAVVRALYGQFTFVNSVPGGAAGYTVFHVLVNLCNLVLLVASARFLYVRRRFLVEYWPLWGPLLALLVFHSFTYMEPRYLFPIRVCTAVMAAAALAQRRSADVEG